MDQFCGSPFWDWSVTWNTNRPDLTPCFQETALVWVPCGFLWLFAPLSVYLTLQYKDRYLPWTILTFFKIFLSCMLGVISVLDISQSMIEYSSGQAVSPSTYYAAFITAITFTLAAVLVNLARMKGSQTSGVLFLFWLLLCIKEIVAFRSVLIRTFNDDVPYSSAVSDFKFVIVTCTLPLVLAQFILSCFSDTTPIYTQAGHYNAKPSPEENASFLSQLTFWWFNSMAALGHRNPLTLGDMWSLSFQNKSKLLDKTFEKHWLPVAAKALRKSPASVNVDEYKLKKNEDDVTVENAPKLNLLVPVLKTYWVQISVAALLKLITSLMAFVSPVILNMLITFVSSDEPYWRGFFYAGVLFFSSMVESLFSGQYEYLIYNVGMKIRATVTATIYKKALVLSSSARRNFTVGEMVNLMSVDVQRVMDFVHMFNLLWSMPLTIILSLYMLWQQIGISTLAGLVLMILLIPINGVFTVKLRKLQVLVMKDKDKRTKLMNEVLNGMKVLKLYGWEESFQEQVSTIRASEVENLKKQSYVTACIFFFFTAAPFMVALASFAMFVLIDPTNVLDANKAFVSLSLFNILKLPFALLPMLITFTAMFSVSLKRLNVYLSCDEIDPDAVSYVQNTGSPIVVENGTFAWDSREEPLLKNINLSPSPGSLVAIVGTVGSGKSSLLSALLGDMEKIEGRVNIGAKVAYVPQQAWIQNATLQKNVLFVKPMEERFYKKVLKACCLNPDLEMLPGGDNTEIGEKGINLSGGQKQRVSLARAVYDNADIYLLDDPLSAVDAHVSKDLFDDVIGPNGLLKNKTKILVTHRITVLPECDSIVVLKDGQISEQGSYEELLNQKGAFAEFLVQHLSQQTFEGGVPTDELQLIEEIAQKVGSPELQRQLSRLSGTESDGHVSEMEGSKTILGRQMSQTSVSSIADSLRKRQSSVGSSRTAENAPKSATERRSKLTEEELAEVGSVNLSVYWAYLKACGWRSTAIVMVSYFLSHAFTVLSSIWLSEWSNDSLDPANQNDTALRDLRLGVYGGLGGGESIFIFVGTMIISLCTVEASRIIHDDSLQHVLQAPMSFFDTTPLGRILNRFSKDVDSMDNVIRSNIRMLLICIFRAFISIIIISLQSAYILVAIIPLGILYYIVQSFYITTSRQLKRLESVSRSPIYTHFSETVTGCSSIRAYSAEKNFIQESYDRMDKNNTTYHPSLGASRWLAVRLEFLGYCISFFTALFAVLSKDTLSAGVVGLTVSYALTITANLNMLVRASADVETNIVAVERCLEYTTTPTEAPRRIESTKPPPDWPSKGIIQFLGYSARYRDGLDLVLRKISCAVKPNEKVGIVGRTGAGKSSLTLSLFRLVEAAEGSIVIDGIDIAKIGLYDLRSKLTIIPQDPVLFAGTLRMNLDPFASHSDEELWKALEQCHLKTYVTSLEKGLSHIVAEAGENLSVGQRQLLCLGRALLRKTKVLIMDEATAAVDMETDELLQATIRSEFADCTVLTIAHRLNTIMDYDRVIVLDKGEIAEFDSTANLLQNEASIFHSMAKDAELI